jgi:hypothetical protein
MSRKQDARLLMADWLKEMRNERGKCDEPLCQACQQITKRIEAVEKIRKVLAEMN